MPRINECKPVNKPCKVAKQKHRFELDDLIYDIEKFEAELAPKMVVFAREYAKGGVTIKDSARVAGYSERSLTQRGTQLVQHSGVMALVNAYKRRDHLENGLPLSWKRYQLKKIVESDTAPESSKISAVRLLAELDGDLRPDLATGQQIFVNLNLGAAQAEGVTVEHGFDRPLSGGRARGIPTDELD